VRRLVPDNRTVALDDAYGDLDPPASGWTALGMVTSVDGAVAVDGVSGGLGGEGDRAAFRALRGLADVVVVGAGTARAEDYGPVVHVPDPAARARRGQARTPRLALVTGSGRIDPEARVVGDPDSPPLVLTTTTGAARIERRGVAVEVVALGEGDRVAPDAALAALRDRGLTRVVLEGGPTLNAAWLAAGVVDELFVTVAPMLVGREGPGIAGTTGTGPLDLVLHELRVHGSEVVLRYRVLGRGYRAGSDRTG
jgi:riboflavin biosynthesis pyrimidine reductase